MADPFVAEIRIVGFNFPPRGWATCNGQLLPIAQNTALFSLLGTTYGGNGVSTFALPDLGGRAPMHPGQGPGLSLRDLGESGGSETVQLAPGQMPAHSHFASAADGPATTNDPTDRLPAVSPEDAYQERGGKAPTPMSPATVGVMGGDQAHNNVQPSLVMNFVIALQGVYPPRP